MNSRLLALLLLLALAGAGFYLWLQPATPPVPPSTPSAPTPTAQAPAPQTDSKPAASDEFFILAVSWQPAFCETAPDKPECRSQTAQRFDASHFTLHGLWPQGEYCGVSAHLEDLDRAGRWSALPAVDLSASLRSELETAMPGTASQLERHEWIKHGTCFDGDAETYYAAALTLLADLNASPVRELFAQNTGKRLTQAQIRAAFDDGFGPGLGERVRVACEDDGDRTLVTQLTLGLWGTIGRDPDLRALLAAARPTSGGCRAGLVDRVGLQ
jgi:ribonuclease T2